MPMGIVSDADFNKELSNVSSTTKDSKDASIKPEAIIKDTNKGRPNGGVEVPDSLRKVIGETSVTNGRAEARALAKNFEISDSSVSAYSKGATSTSSYDERPNSSIVDGAKLRIQKKARSRLIAAINNITAEKLEGTKPRDLAGIAKDMAVVIKNMEPESSKTPVNTGPTFVFYSPQPRKEEAFDVVFTKD